jgi:hypothetical protein
MLLRAADEEAEWVLRLLADELGDDVFQYAGYLMLLQVGTGCGGVCRHRGQGHGGSGKRGESPTRCALRKEIGDRRDGSCAGALMIECAAPSSLRVSSDERVREEDTAVQCAEAQ